MTPIYPDNLAELAQSLLWPLNLFYVFYSREMPLITPLFEHHIPEPYRALLVHEGNMTPTLEAFHSATLYIERLNVVPDSEETSREVILRRDRDKKPVEYGASRVFLKTLPDKAVNLITEGRVPLGTVLNQCGCTHTVDPSGFFKIQPTKFFSNIFPGLNGSPLYGRRNTLVAPNGKPIAEVCEILPPAHDKDKSKESSLGGASTA